MFLKRNTYVTRMFRFVVYFYAEMYWNFYEKILFYNLYNTQL